LGVVQTQILPIDPGEPQDPPLFEACKVLEKGGLVAFPTDTFYALGADPFNPLSVEKVFLAKGRARSKPLLLLAADLEMVGQAVLEIPPSTRELISHFWPGPLTLVMRASPRLPPLVTAGTSKVGIRVPRSPISLALLNKMARPLTGTSANSSEAKDAITAGAVWEDLRGRIDLILDGGPSPGVAPSTILDVTTYPPILLREGSISREVIAALVPVTIAGKRET